jgi:hypothetical protein
VSSSAGNGQNLVGEDKKERRKEKSKTAGENQTRKNQREWDDRVLH